MAIPSNAVELVNEGFEITTQMAEDAFDAATDAIDELATYELPAIEISIPEFGELDLGSIAVPDPPDDPGGITPVLPDVPPEVNVQSPPAVDLSGLPELTEGPLQLALPQLPDAFNQQPPEDPAPAAAIEMPVLVEPDLPDVPALVGINIPANPDITIPEFGETIPDFDLDFDIGEFTYNEDIYDSALLNTLRARITDMVDGGTGLPAPIETALFDRVRTREQDTALAAHQSAIEEWSSRGFSLPGGDISRRLREAREARRAAENTANRDIMVQVHNAALDQLKAGVASGIQLEAAYMNYLGGYADRALRAAVAVVEMSVSVLNARIGFFNVQLARVQLAATIYETQVRAVLAQIEIFKAQIEAEKLKVDINTQNVQLYQAQINAALSLLEIYKAKLDGVKVQVDVRRNEIETYKARVEAFGTLVQAKKTEYEGYTAAVQGEVAKVGIYEATVRAYSSRVQAYAARVGAQAQVNESFVATEKLKVDQYDSRIRAYAAQVTGEVERVRSLTGVFATQVQRYAAIANFNEAKARIGVAQAEVAVTAGNAQAQIVTQAVIEQARLAVQSSSQVLEAIKSAGSIASQLAAGALSAINTSAGIEGSESINHNLSGDSPFSA